MMSRFALLACLLLLAAPAWAQEDDPIGPQPTLPTQTLVVQGHGGPPHAFTVEMATTPREQQVG